ncbi:MAG: hypothetical protein C5B60_10540 [Chloroflexi bacterium]|nr:MAG: hypothetical protein C5B60_10540 [Chloroflexota bacterium]
MSEGQLERLLRIIRDMGLLAHRTTQDAPCESERQARLLLVLGQIVGMADRVLDDDGAWGP